MSSHRKTTNNENRKSFHNDLHIDNSKSKGDSRVKSKSMSKNDTAKSKGSIFKPNNTLISNRIAGGDAIIEEEDDIFFFETENPHTIFLLLDSPEPNVVNKVLQYFSKKAEALDFYARKLHEMKIVEKILDKNFFSENSYEDQLACLRLIYSICQLDQEYDVKKTIRENEEEIEPKFEYDTIEKLYDITKDYILKSNDYVVIEDSAGIASNLLDESRKKLELEQDDNYLQRIFNLVKLADNDEVIYNCLSMVNKILPALTNFTPFYNFPFVNTVQVISNSDSAKTQEMALTVLAGVITTIQDERLLNQLVNSTFLYDVLFLLETPEKSSCHPKLLAALKSIMKIEKIAKNFFGDQLLQGLFMYARSNDENFIATVNILCELTAYPQAIENLYEFGLIDLLFESLNNHLREVGSDICIAFSRMFKFPKGYTMIVVRNPITNLLKILADENRTWDIREQSADTICYLISRSFILAESLVKSYFELVTINLLNRPFGVVTPECILKIIDMINILHKFEDLRELVMTLNLSNCLLLTIQESFRSADILSSLLNCISIYICEQQLQEVLLENENFCDIIFRCLRSPATIVKSAVTILIMLSGKMKQFSDKYIENGILEKLITDQQSLSTCETWSPAIETILNTNPSIKFCVHARLDFTDKIAPDFYISKRPLASYRVLCQILCDEVSPLYPLLIVNYDHVVSMAATVVQVKSGNETSVPRKSKVTSKTSSGNEEDWTYCRRPSDCNLPKYLEMVKNSIESLGLSQSNDNKDFIDITRLDERAKVVAEVVFNEMCGDRPGKQTEICSESAVINHLHQLKCHLHCNIIPLGQIRFGGHFERAVLFKSLCDQIGLPCSLKRNVDNKILYCELPVPLQLTKFPLIKQIPVEHLVPTHIIDLMDSPGELYPINSPEAFKYLNLV